MDEIDVKILKILSENSRISLSDLAGIVNLSIPAVSERVKKLENSNAILKYTTKLDSSYFGLNLQCYCLIRLGPKGIYDEVFLNM